MKKQLLLILMALLPMLAWADPVEIDGIYYNLVFKLKTAEVTKKPNGEYTGIVTIPESVTYEGTQYNVTSIGESAFYMCRGLTSITIPNSVKSIGYEAFWACSGLKSVTIPNSVTSILNGAFGVCGNLTSVTIGNSVTNIGYEAFIRCSSLTSITIPNSVTSIGGSAFEDCSGLTSITIGNGLKTVDQKVFTRCSGLTSVHISDLSAWCKINFSSNSNPLYYANHLYVNNEEVTELVIPNDITSLGTYTFMGCSGLKSLIIPNSVTSIGVGAFFGCSGLKSVTIPNSVTSIGSFIFYGCSGLTSVIIPNSVTSIDGFAFSGCSNLKSVSIGSGVKTIDSYAFGSCPELTDVTCHAENVPSTNTDAFKDSYIEYTTLHVPASAVNAYKVADPWKNFKSIMATDGTTPETPETQKCETPTISYGGKKLSFSCTTEGVEYVYEIKDSDIKKGYDREIQLTATYEISVYATKAGYDNSDVATATLVWGSASFTETTEPTAVRELTNNHDAPLLIQSHNGVLTIQGADDGQQVRVYGINGTEAGAAVSSNGQAVVGTNLKAGSVAIIKIGDRSVKTVVK